MPTTSKSHYDTLDIDKDATNDEIKKAYRKLSLQYHPDRNAGSQEAKERFQQISEAYGVLSNPEKRAEYDDELNGVQRFPAGFPPGFMPGGNDDLSQIFGMMFGGHGGMGMGMGPGVHIFHGAPPGDIFRQLHKPPPVMKQLVVSLEQCFGGAVVPVEVEKWRVEGGNTRVLTKETVYVTLPPGIDNNEVIVMRDCGNYVSEDLVGDIKFVVQVEPHATFQRQGMDLVHKRTISLKEALTGFAFDLQHLNGKVLCLNNTTKRTVISPEFRKVIPGMGISREHHTGNLVIVFHVQFPESLDESVMDQLQTLLP